MEAGLNAHNLARKIIPWVDKAGCADANDGEIRIFYVVVDRFYIVLALATDIDKEIIFEFVWKPSPIFWRLTSPNHLRVVVATFNPAHLFD